MIKLNLLPPEIKEEISYSKKNAKIYTALIEFLGGFLILAIFIGTVWFVSFSTKRVLVFSKAVAEKQAAAWGDAEKDAKDFSDRLLLVERINKDKINWKIFFEEISKSTPSNVKLTSYDVITSNKSRVNFSGFASSSTDVSRFRELISKSGIFEFVDIESMSSATDPADSTRRGLTFKVTAGLKLSEVKKWQ
jgi:Tfp pilus assembly protein PilN